MEDREGREGREGRAHAERLRYDLGEIRKELVETVADLSPEELNWSPKPEMKTVRQILQEIGSMEELSRGWAAEAVMPDWNEIWEKLDRPTASEILTELEAVRSRTLAYLETCSEKQLQTPIPLREDWWQYFGGAKELEPEELLRWVVRHEYYHLGQLIIYRWQQGKAV